MSRVKDLTGQKFNRLTVIKFAGRNKWRSSMWECLCDCGNKSVVRGYDLTSGTIKSCGCYGKERAYEVNFKDLTGQRFGRLIAIRKDGVSKWGDTLWFCRCDCGNEKTIRSSRLISGGTKSCGCLQRERSSKAHFKDLTGQKFGMLTVLKEAGRSEREKVLWLCRCDCGNERIIRGDALVDGGTQSCGCLQKKSASEIHSGEGNFNWKGGVTPLNLSIRTCVENLHWRLDVFARDGFVCQRCGSKKKLNAHHKKHFAKIIEENNITTLEEAKNCKELWDISNGETLCEDCHKKEHKVRLKIAV